MLRLGIVELDRLEVAENGGKSVMAINQVTDLAEERHIQEFLSHIHLESAFLEAVARSATALSIEIWSPDNQINGVPAS